ncbi:MAG: hypothetical protein ACYTG1_02975 [Planctomycetota bacterium]|jgi:hypothetical protein
MLYAVFLLITPLLALATLRGLRRLPTNLIWIVIALGVALTAVTSYLSWLGIRDWSGATGGNWLFIFGLPLWVPMMILGYYGVPVGIATQLIACTFVAWAVIAIARRLRRKADPTRCKCGYSLTGIKSGRCPECGREAP